MAIIRTEENSWLREVRTTDGVEDRVCLYPIMDGDEWDKDYFVRAAYLPINWHDYVVMNAEALEWQAVIAIADGMDSLSIPEAKAILKALARAIEIAEGMGDE